MKKIDPELKRQNKLAYDRRYYWDHVEERRRKGREYMRKRKVELYLKGR